ncbi:helix-turn-helix domain-containing protein [Streptomyces sp. NBC_00237]|uniref:helix-turn-helix domain-containing protein n=1 Tax=Streptomyces sp. NBC_00237 TaxID=2975687 RepID=UPI0022563DBA|nr:helix-turn-helix transcriptional regulator [Streptomyces sp. NBC_00237]MCX5201875.1 helix-turn-helix domain-containing protein [Streptomyces sp. NBC_00237]
MNRKELNPDSSPQAAFGAHLRSMRETHGWTQEELAKLMEYSSAHVSSVETGRKLSTLRFARTADRVFGTAGAQESFERKWREIRQGSLLEGFPEYVGYEGRAVELRVFDIGIVPGLLQTPEYAQVLADSAVRRGAITPEQATERVSVLTERQQELQRSRPPMVFVVLDESCVRRTVGGRDVMSAQLDHLVQFAARPTTMLQVAPFDMGERRSLNLPVHLLTMADRSVIAYTESQAQGSLDREATSVHPLLTTYHQLQAEALSQAATVAMIEEARKGIQ